MSVLSSSIMNAQTDSRFCGLPPELRNEIYALLTNHETATIDFDEAAPPATDILISWKTIYNEAKKVIYLARRQYWETNSFRFSKPTGSYRATEFTPSESIHIEHMHRIEITTLVHERSTTVSLCRSTADEFQWDIVASGDLMTDNSWRICFQAARIDAMRKVMDAQAGQLRRTSHQRRAARSGTVERRLRTASDQATEDVEEAPSSTGMARGENMRARDLEVLLNCGQAW